MIKSFKELLNEHLDVRRDRFSKVLQWIEIEQKSLYSCGLSFEEIGKKHALEYELFGRNR